ncbi:MAG: hypothetical protein KKF44_02590 [Nanoarchaeota archaeon]|nr:hypothetical protein [Nanoarchaeota archaeon]
MDSFHQYMKKQLKRYILEEEKKGVPLETIEQALLDAGHKRNVLDEVFSELEKEEAGLKSEVPDGAVEKDMVSNVKDSIKGFFGQIQSKDVKKVKKEVNGSSNEDIVEEAIEEYETEKETYMLEGFAFVLYLAALIISVFYVAGTTGDEIMYVAMGLSPAFINSFISFGLVKFSEYAPVFMLIPIGVAGAFFALASSGIVASFARMEYEALAIINVGLAIVFNLLLIVISSSKPRPVHKFPRHASPARQAQPMAQAETVRQETNQKQYEQKKHVDNIEYSDPDIKRFQKHIDDLKTEFNIQD